MSGSNTFPLIGKSRELLRERTDFFSSVSEANKQTHLNPRLRDPDVRVEKTLLPNNEVEVVFVYGLDDNDSPADGRIYFRDRFVFDEKEKFKGFNRQFSGNGKGDQKQWQEWLAVYEANNPKPSDDKIKDFASVVARRYLGITQWKTLSDGMRETLNVHKDYLQQVRETTQSVNAGLVLKGGDPQTHFTLEYLGDDIVFTLTIVADKDNDPEKGRIFLNDRFVFDSHTHEMKGDMERTWEIAPDVEPSPALQETLDALDRKAGPSSELTKGLLADLIPQLPLFGEEAFKSSLSQIVGKLPKPVAAPPVASAQPTQQKSMDTRRFSSNLVSLEMMRDVASEQLEKRYQESQGWLKRLFGEKIDIDKSRAAIKSLFEKTAANVLGEKGEDLFGVMRDLKLNPAEAELRDKILSDPIQQGMSNVAKERDAQLRAEDFLRIARKDLFQDAGLVNSAARIAQQLLIYPTVKARAEEILALAEGRASNASKIEFLAPRFTKEVANPTTLVPMFLAPLVGNTFEFGALKLVELAKGGDIARFIASQWGIFGEALGFATVHRTATSLVNNPHEEWKNFPKEIGSAYFLFNGMRLAHWTAGGISTQLVKTPVFGRSVTEDALSEFPVAPTGRVITSFGTLPRQLSRSGMVLHEFLQHGGGVAAMLGAGYLNRAAHLEKDNKQGFAGHLFDALMMYTQATAGFHLANRASGGQFQSALAEYRLRLDNVGGQQKVSSDSSAPASKPSQPPGKKIDRDSDEKTSTNIQVPGGIAPKPTGPSAADAEESETNDTMPKMFPDFPPESVGPLPRYEDAPAEDTDVDEPQTQPKIPRPPESDFDDAPTQVRKPTPRPPADSKPVVKFTFAGFEGKNFELPLAKEFTTIQFGREVSEVSPLPSQGTMMRLGQGAESHIVHVLVGSEQNTVSKSHARLVRGKDGAWYLGDCQSAYGTRINGQRIKPGIGHPVKPGNKIRLGDGPEFTLNIEGEFKDYHSLKLHEVPVPVFPLQPKPNPPEVAEEFPFSAVFPGQKIDPDQIYQVATLQPSGDKKPVVFNSDKHPWGITFPQGKKSDPLTVGTLYVDTKGRWVWNDHVGEHGVKLDGQVVNGWAFVKSGTVFNMPKSPWILRIEQKPLEKPSKNDQEDITLVGSPAQEVLDKSRQPEVERPTLTNIKVKLLPIVFSQLPPSLLANLPKGQGPINLRQIVDGQEKVVTNPSAVSYYIKERPQSNQLEVSSSIKETTEALAQIYYGKLDQETGWWLRDNVSGYKIIHNGSTLGHVQAVRLQFGDVITLTDSIGTKEALKIVIEKPSIPAKSETEAATPDEDLTRPNVLFILQGAPEVAKEFPAAALAGLDPNQPPMTLVGKNKTEAADRRHTIYILGSEPHTENLPAKTHTFRVSALRVSPDHAAVFIDKEGRWWVTDIKSEHGTYLNGHKLDKGSAAGLNDGDEIGLGGTEDAPESSRVIIFKLPQKSREDSVPYENLDDLLDNKEDAEADDDETTQVKVSPSPRPKSPPPPVPGAIPKSPLPPPPRKPTGTSDRPVTAPDVQPGRVPPPSPPPGRPSGGQRGRVDPLATTHESRNSSQPPSARHTDALEGSRIINLEGLQADRPAEGSISKMPTDPTASSGGRTPSVKSPAPVTLSTILTGREKAPAVPGAGRASPPPPPSARGIRRNTPKSFPPPPQADAIRDSQPPTTRRDTPQASPLPSPNTAARPASPQGTALVAALRPYFNADQQIFDQNLSDLESFPKLEKNKIVMGEPGKPLDFVYRFEGKYPHYKKLLHLVGRIHNKLQNSFRLATDEKQIRFSSFPDEVRPDTVITFRLNPGVDEAVLTAAFKLIQQNKPLEVLIPLHVSQNSPGYLSVFYQSRDAEDFYKAALEVTQEFPQILAGAVMPFARQMVDEKGQVIPGLGVMEYALDGSMDPLQRRQVLLRMAYENSKKNRPDGINLGLYLQEVRKLFDQHNYDIENPAFHNGSAQGSHRVVVGQTVK